MDECAEVFKRELLGHFALIARLNVSSTPKKAGAGGVEEDQEGFRVRLDDQPVVRAPVQRPVVATGHSGEHAIEFVEHPGAVVGLEDSEMVNPADIG
jgi:hypothetical protein